MIPSNFHIPILFVSPDTTVQIRQCNSIYRAYTGIIGSLSCLTHPPHFLLQGRVTCPAASLPGGGTSVSLTATPCSGYWELLRRSATCLCLPCSTSILSLLIWRHLHLRRHLRLLLHYQTAEEIHSTGTPCTHTLDSGLAELAFLSASTLYSFFFVLYLV